MSFILKAAFVFGALATTVTAHGYVSGVVADGKYYGGWHVDYWYDDVNHVSYPAPVGWYEEALDIGFIPPDQYK